MLQAVRLWLHECKRVLSDRLVSEQDIARFSEFCGTVVRKYFGHMKLVRLVGWAFYDDKST